MQTKLVKNYATLRKSMISEVKIRK